VRARKLRTIAKRWWRLSKKYNYYDDARVERLRMTPTAIPSLLSALAATAPPDRLHYAGTTVLEDIYHDAGFFDRPNRVFDYLKRARLTDVQLFAMVSGVYPYLLEEWGIREQLASRLSTEQIEWLTNREAPGRGDYL
jgi:hypothetical protein